MHAALLSYLASGPAYPQKCSPSTRAMHSGRQALSAHASMDRLDRDQVSPALRRTTAPYQRPRVHRPRRNHRGREWRDDTKSRGPSRLNRTVVAAVLRFLRDGPHEACRRSHFRRKDARASTSPRAPDTERPSSKRSLRKVPAWRLVGPNRRPVGDCVTNAGGWPMPPTVRSEMHEATQPWTISRGRLPCARGRYA